MTRPGEFGRGDTARGAADSRSSLYAKYVSTHTSTYNARRGGTRWFPLESHLGGDLSVRILDVGCGSGDFLLHLRNRGYAATFGIDISSEQVRLAEERGLVNVVCSDLEDYCHTTTQTFDVITMMDVLEHFTVDEAIQVVQAVAGILEPNGRLLAQVPNATSPYFGNYAYADLTHRSVFTARSVRQLARICGLEIQEVHGVGVAPGGGPARLARRVVFGTAAVAMKTALAAETGQLRGHIVTQNLVFVAAKPPGVKDLDNSERVSTR